MNEEILQSARHAKLRSVLRIGGTVIATVGLILIVVGFASFFAAFNDLSVDHPPRFIWCAFIGLPMLIFGLAMCMFGFFGAFQRYVAAESVPVSKDIVNYVGENIQPGVKAMAKAVTEGVIEAQQEQQRKA